MEGINCSKPITYLSASYRYFKAGEHHIDRVGKSDVLLLVFDGILRFTEDGVPYEIGPAHYHIQKSGSVQSGASVSDEPKYLYVHFHGEWTDDETLPRIPKGGTFDPAALSPLMDSLDRAAHGKAAYLQQSSIFLQILNTLACQNRVYTLADEIADYIENRYAEKLTLTDIADAFHFSSNHIISIFRRQFSVTPYEYVLDIRIRKAKWLLEVTSDTLESIAQCCGFGSYTHFYKMFRQRTGIPPAQWRQQMRWRNP